VVSVSSVRAMAVDFGASWKTTSRRRCEEQLDWYNVYIISYSVIIMFLIFRKLSSLV